MGGRIGVCGMFGLVRKAEKLRDRGDFLNSEI